MAPLSPFVLLLNQFDGLRRRIWPWVRRWLQISCQPVQQSLTDWHDYRLHWDKASCTFLVDGEIIHQTAYCPRGPLGFVCWIDNQYMVATPHGRFRWGTLPAASPQWLEILGLELKRIVA